MKTCSLGRMQEEEEGEEEEVVSVSQFVRRCQAAARVDLTSTGHILRRSPVGA